MKWGWHSHCFMFFSQDFAVLLIITELFQNVYNLNHHFFLWYCKPFMFPAVFLQGFLK